MRLDEILETAQSLVSNIPPAVKDGTKTAKKTAFDAADVIATRAEDAREVVVEKADDVKNFTVQNMFRAYDIASRLVPMILPERASRVRNRRIAYAAAGGLLLGAGAIVILEMRRPGTLASFGKRVQRLTGRAVDGVETELVHAKDKVVTAATDAKEKVATVAGDVKDTVKGATSSATHALEDVKEKAAHGVDAMKERVAHLGARVEDGAKEVKHEAKKDFEQAKDKIAQAIDAESARTFANGNRHS